MVAMLALAVYLKLSTYLTALFEIKQSCGQEQLSMNKSKQSTEKQIALNEERTPTPSSRWRLALPTEHGLWKLLIVQVKIIHCNR